MELTELSKQILNDIKNGISDFHKNVADELYLLSINGYIEYYKFKNHPKGFSRPYENGVIAFSDLKLTEKGESVLNSGI